MISAILDETGRFVRRANPNEIGSILINRPNVFRGYLDPGHNAGLWIEIDGERWLNTGDLGRQDPDGYFWLTGRRKELIIRGGHNIDPKVIEEALQAHPAVAPWPRRSAVLTLIPVRSRWLMSRPSPGPRSLRRS